MDDPAEDFMQLARMLRAYADNSGRAPRPDLFRDTAAALEERARRLASAAGGAPGLYAHVNLLV